MYRLYEARCHDLGHANESGDTDWEKLADIVSGEADFGEEGGTNRFKMFCEQKCYNRKVSLQNLGIGTHFAKELACILSVNKDIA